MEATAWEELKTALGRVRVIVSELKGGSFEFITNLEAFRRWVGSVAFSFEPERYLSYPGRSAPNRSGSVTDRGLASRIRLLARKAGT